MNFNGLAYDRTLSGRIPQSLCAGPCFSCSAAPSFGDLCGRLFFAPADLRNKKARSKRAFVIVFLMRSPCNPATHDVQRFCYFYVRSRQGTLLLFDDIDRVSSLETGAKSNRNSGHVQRFDRNIFRASKPRFFHLEIKNLKAGAALGRQRPAQQHGYWR